MTTTVQELLRQTGLEAPLSPGQIRQIKKVGEKAGTSYTIVYDWKSRLDQILIEVRPGLTGEIPSKKELAQYALWLQTVNRLVLNVTPSTKH